MTWTRSRVWTAGAAGLCVLMVLIGWFVAVSPKRAEAASLNALALSQEARNAALETELAGLRIEAEDLPATEAELAELRTQIPEQADLPALLRELQAAATAADIPLQRIEPAPPQLPELTGAETVDPNAAVTTPAAGEALLQVPISFTAEGGYPQARAFLRSLQHDMDRVLLVNQIGFTALPVAEGPDGAPEGTVTLAVTATAFVYGDPATAVTAATPDEAETPAAGSADASAQEPGDAVITEEETP